MSAKSKKKAAAKATKKRETTVTPIVKDEGGRPMRGKERSKPHSFSLTDREYQDILKVAHEMGFPSGSEYVRAMHAQFSGPALSKVSGEARRYGKDFQGFVAFLYDYWKTTTKGVIPEAS